ncbi:MAG: hypothetical protein NC489_39105 [Ruminococcus flavefaciens]|nr:hypothetical protein [Ruminococcus flavefaciens]
MRQLYSLAEPSEGAQALAAAVADMVIAKARTFKDALDAVELASDLLPERSRPVSVKDLDKKTTGEN